ncbi:hypothetical protein [Glutamicibacter arilaitensis]|uniref:Uncharacterized protein n=1 Tax=Glutamicibacter arilaitensis TaxID=256701 RepID=A0A2N7S5F9_9MICC|nr:hypothetical protein [Glutamicibacter arilaitensis]PMQ21374.1 hypothetical protein CIK84_07430 [Glutamicibacter arilaitensis]
MAEKLNFTVEYSGNTENVTAIYADLVKYDILRARHNFPKREESDFLFMALVAFAALIRVGKVAQGTKVEDFLNSLEGITPEDDAEEAEADFQPDGAE